MRGALVLALTRTLDGLEHYEAVGDEVMVAVAGGVVRQLLAHPDAADLGDDLGWRRQLRRWVSLRARVAPVPLDLLDEVVRLATVRLVHAERAAQLAAGATA